MLPKLKIVYIILILSLFSCLKQKTLHDLKYQELYTYIDNSGLVFSQLKSGIYLHSNFEGVGAKFRKRDRVKLVFNAAYLDDKEGLTYFAKNDTFSFVVGDREILSAWNDIVVNFSVAGSGIAVIPYDKAYGKYHTPNIPPNSNLVYFFRFLSDDYAIDQLSIFYEYLGTSTDNVYFYTDTLAYIKYFDGFEEDNFPNGTYIELSMSTLDNDSLFYNNDNYYFIENNTVLPKGLVEGISMMKPGEMGKIVIPPSLSYTQTNTYGIDPYRSLYCVVRRKANTHKEEEESQINKFLYLNNFSPDSILPDSLYIIRIERGDGDKVKSGDLISYSDSLYLINTDTKISGCNDCQKTVNSSNFESWQLEALGHMYGGDKVTFIVPYSIAYGSSGSGSIPPYATLVYYIHVKSID